MRTLARRRSSSASLGIAGCGDDPLYELMMPLGLHKVEDRTWQHSQLGVDGGEVVRLSERFETERTVRKRAWMADRNQKADKLKC